MRADRQIFASHFLDAPMRSLVRPSNVSQVLLDYPRYLHHQEVKLQSFLSTSASWVSVWNDETCDIHRPTLRRGGKNGI